MLPGPALPEGFAIPRQIQSIFESRGNAMAWRGPMVKGRCAEHMVWPSFSNQGIAGSLQWALLSKQCGKGDEDPSSRNDWVSTPACRSKWQTERDWCKREKVLGLGEVAFWTFLSVVIYSIWIFYSKLISSLYFMKRIKEIFKIKAASNRNQNLV